MKRSAVVLVLLALLTACGDSSEKRAALARQQRDTYRVRVNGAIVFSPLGEPLSGGALGKLSCPEALSMWFDRADHDKNGGIDINEFMVDARVQFLRMDRDGDGALYPAELEVFRDPYKGSTRKTNNLTSEATVNDAMSEARDAEMARIRAAGYTSGITDKDKLGINKMDLSDISDPVMSADTNLDFKVTLEEYTTQAQELFKKIDTDHDGKLQRLEVLNTCPLIFSK